MRKLKYSCRAECARVEAGFSFQAKELFEELEMQKTDSYFRGGRVPLVLK